jgi:L-lactate dehydrogenase complex protein LldF
MVDLDKQLYHHRQDIVSAGLMAWKKRNILRATAWLMAHPKLMDGAGKVARKIVPLLPRKIVYAKANIWGRGRELPSMPKQSFKELYKKDKK